jgi:hypothetical protein
MDLNEKGKLSVTDVFGLLKMADWQDYVTSRQRQQEQAD